MMRPRCSVSLFGLTANLQIPAGEPADPLAIAHASDRFERLHAIEQVAARTVVRNYSIAPANARRIACGTIDR